MLQRLAITLFIILGVHYMNANEIKHIEINGVAIPVISETSHVIPVGHVELIFIGGGNMFNPPKQPLAKVASAILNYGTKKLGNVGFADIHNYGISFLTPT